MSVVLEELLLKLKVDPSQVGPALKEFENQVGHAAKEGHKWFQHVGSSGRAFHRIMQEMSQQSPILGNALRIALSPIGGTLMAAGAAFAYLNKKIEEGNARLDEMASINKSVFHDIRDGAAAATKEVANLNRELEKTARKEVKGDKNTAEKSAFQFALEGMSAGEKIQKGHLDAKKDLEINKVDHLEHTGAISQGEAMRRRNKIELDYETNARTLGIESVKGRALAHGIRSESLVSPISSSERKEA